MEMLIAFLIAVVAGVVTHIICKWLDGKTKIAVTGLVSPNPKGQ